MLTMASHTSTATIARNGETIKSMRLLMASHWVTFANEVTRALMSTYAIFISVLPSLPELLGYRKKLVLAFVSKPNL